MSEPFSAVLQQEIGPLLRGDYDADAATRARRMHTQRSRKRVDRHTSRHSENMTKRANTPGAPEPSVEEGCPKGAEFLTQRRETMKSDILH